MKKEGRGLREERERRFGAAIEEDEEMAAAAMAACERSG